MLFEAAAWRAGKLVMPVLISREMRCSVVDVDAWSAVVMAWRLEICNRELYIQ